MLHCFINIRETPAREPQKENWALSLCVYQLLIKKTLQTALQALEKKGLFHSTALFSLRGAYISVPKKERSETPWPRTSHCWGSSWAQAAPVVGCVYEMPQGDWVHGTLRRPKEKTGDGKEEGSWNNIQGNPRIGEVGYLIPVPHREPSQKKDGYRCVWAFKAEEKRPLCPFSSNLCCLSMKSCLSVSCCTCSSGGGILKACRCSERHLE